MNENNDWFIVLSAGHILALILILGFLLIDAYEIKHDSIHNYKIFKVEEVR